ncbi:Transcriptional regulator, lysR family [Alloalcanivorax dieselolei B5]|uniref:Transcriptional regulator, lysR family n=1 Tax=Alcanivorax dieselolei (strain DSM 16502 / CGMCC 1.3690 / MCCC 1A00001 / B-5) TaxID=930169 RepID=K0CAV5_ALCDB|nr:LysR family transcriptional regulator [Alloalcanivorax dieselolei]AFT70694.1 Transcriptional regulator, lysR family [Alloalcanivorax dieselolei B5]GGJ97015.1 LysR family transcriptional regulator [Alloalcanivorax dieselolei]
MDLQQLTVFVTVAREGSITRASRRLCLSQPAISARVQALEQSLSLTLFQRTPRGMSLTADGEILLTRAEAVLAARQDLLRQAARLGGGPAGRLRLGAGHNIQPAPLRRLLTELARHHPDVDVALEYGASRDLAEALQRGALDAAFYHRAGPAEEGLIAWELARFSIQLVAPSDWVTPGPLDWRRLETLPWICPGADSGCGRAAEALFRRHGIRPPRIIRVDKESMTRGLVAAGAGLGLVHEGGTDEARRQDGVTVLCEAGPPVRLVFAHRADRADDPLLNVVSALVDGAPVH